MTTNYKFAAIVEVDIEYKINDLNIWNHNWNCTNQKVEVKGPFEGQVYFFKEYEIQYGDKTIHFVAGEFINGKIGIYVKDELSDGKI